MNVGLIGNGYWGKIYENVLTDMMFKYRAINELSIYTHDYKKLAERKDIDCVIVATPLETHFKITKYCLELGKHVLLEKPFTSTREEATELSSLASSKNLILLPGHIYLHHDGIQKLKTMIDRGDLGYTIESAYSQRMSNSKHSNALWDMGAHDIYIFDHFFGTNKVKTVMGDNTHCIFHLKYNNTDVYVENCSYYGEKRRTIIINGNQKRAIFNDNAKPDEKLYTVDRITGEIKFIKVESEPTTLEKQCSHFFNLILKNSETIPVVTIADAISNIKTLEQITYML